MEGKVISKQILFAGHRCILACDANCAKAWGISRRARVQLSLEDEDDYAFLSDGELGIAPEDPGTYEGDEWKPRTEAERLNKWCCRECERSVMVEPGEPIKLPDFSRRQYNIEPHERD